MNGVFRIRAPRRRHSILPACGLLIGLLLIGALGVGSAQPPPPQRLAGAVPGDCALCHGSTPVLPDGHVATKPMDWAGCAACHTGNKTLRTRVPLSHTHLLAGVRCQDCHGSLPASGPVMSEQCLTCHGTREDVAGRTKARQPNPHNSPHHGAEVDCDQCHHQHFRSEDICAQCHPWKTVVPNQP